MSPPLLLFQYLLLQLVEGYEVSQLRQWVCRVTTPFRILRKHFLTMKMYYPFNTIKTYGRDYVYKPIP